MDALSKLLSTLTPDLTPRFLREFHAEVARALADGKLTEDEIATLEKRKEELGISDEALSAVRQQLYAAAFDYVKDDAAVTEDEWDEMEHIQDYLGLKDADIAKTKKDLYRLRILTEIRAGNLPVTYDDSLILENDEIVYWIEKVDVLEPPEHVESSEKTVKTEGWETLDKGKLFITSERIVIDGKEKTSADRLSRVVGTDFFTNGMILRRNGRKTVFLRYATPGNHNVVASVLLAAIDRARRQ